MMAKTKPAKRDDILEVLALLEQALRDLRSDRMPGTVDLLEITADESACVLPMPSEDDSLHPPAPGDRPAHTRAPEAVRPDLRLFDDEHEPEPEH